MASSQDRYDTTLDTKKLPDGRTVYVSARPKTIDEDIEDITITADELDRADTISHNVYGSAAEWWRIVAANKNFKGSLFFTPGQQIKISRKF